MWDAELVAAILAGDRGGRTAGYDRYAARLYAYSSAVLGEPAGAAGAVRHAFLVAASRLDELSDRDRLRPWLYALARNECRRRLRILGGPCRGVPAAAGRLEAWIQAQAAMALAGLSTGDRDVIELHLRHGLAGPDLAAVLGVPASRAAEVASRAVGLLENSLDVLLTVHAGRADCPDLDAMLGAWDGRPTPLLRQHAGRHIKHCDPCGASRGRLPGTAKLLGLLPWPELPAGLRHQVLKLMTSTAPDAAACRHFEAHSAEPFGATGFPVPLDPPGPGRLLPRPLGSRSELGVTTIRSGS